MRSSRGARFPSTLRLGMVAVWKHRAPPLSRQMLGPTRACPRDPPLPAGDAMEGLVAVSVVRVVRDGFRASGKRAAPTRPRRPRRCLWGTCPRPCLRPPGQSQGAVLPEGALVRGGGAEAADRLEGRETARARRLLDGAFRSRRGRISALRSRVRASSARGGFDSLAANARRRRDGARGGGRFRMKLSVWSRIPRDRRDGNLPPRFSRERSHAFVRMPPRPERAGDSSAPADDSSSLGDSAGAPRCGASEGGTPPGTGARLSDPTHALAVRRRIGTPLS